MLVASTLPLMNECYQFTTCVCSPNVAKKIIAGLRMFEMAFFCRIKAYGNNIILNVLERARRNSLYSSRICSDGLFPRSDVASCHEDLCACDTHGSLNKAFHQTVVQPAFNSLSNSLFWLWKTAKRAKGTLWMTGRGGSLSSGPSEKQACEARSHEEAASDSSTDRQPEAEFRFRCCSH